VAWLMVNRSRSDAILPHIVFLAYTVTLPTLRPICPAEPLGCVIAETGRAVT
jgi:hypothetical protein